MKPVAILPEYVISEIFPTSLLSCVTLLLLVDKATSIDDSISLR